MKKDIRKAVRLAVIYKIKDDMLPLTVGGHTVTLGLVYAGCSQWSGCGRDWDTTRAETAMIVDGQYQLTYPKLDYFDGHNQIERQSRYYLQPDRSETPPDGPVGEPLERVPDKILLAIAAGLAEAIAAHEAAQDQEDAAAADLIARLS